MQIYDIAIIGAGPAGATLARLLKGLRVAVIDRKSQDESSFKKPCGGLLAPDAQQSLSRFNLELPASVLAYPQVFSVKTIDMNSGIVRSYHRNYINMDRHKFDMWLLSLIPAAVDVFLNAKCVGINGENGLYSLEYISDGVRKSIKAKYIVGADGANSLVRRTFFMHTICQYTAIQEWYSKGDSDPVYTAIFDNDITPSYAWGLEKDGYFILGAALAPTDARQNFETLKGKLRQYGYKLDTPVKKEACIALSPMSLNDTLTGSDSVFLAGEAGGFISPSSLEGLSYAMDSASILADALNSDFERAGQLYRRNMRYLRLKLLLKRVKMPFMYNKALRSLVMRSGLTAIKKSP